MDTTAAATLAGVTVATIRTWCRMGAVTATKRSGRWVIDSDSLTRRITIGATRRRTQPEAPVEESKPIVYSVETMTAIGGNRWRKAGRDRIYLDWTEFVPLEIERYKSGSIWSAAWDGEGISNSQAYKILGSLHGVYYDVASRELCVEYGGRSSRVVEREEVWEAVVSGVRAAIAAL